MSKVTHPYLPCSKACLLHLYAFKSMERVKGKALALGALRTCKRKEAPAGPSQRESRKASVSSGLFYSRHGTQVESAIPWH